ncbi:MAG: plastocyanin/azurin family copper-binding protein [Acidimicrobiia bacterium]
MRKFALAVAFTGLVAAACTSGGDSDSEPSEGPDDVADTLATPVMPAVDSDAAPPDVFPTEPAGAQGSSHFVFEEVDGDVLLGLVEGPATQQVRCIDAEGPCSYAELKDLAESGGEVPDALAMSRDELEELVAQLDEVNAAISGYTVEKACAEGFHRTTDQTPNMGAHFFHNGRINDGEFDPSRPEVLLFATPGGAEPPDTSDYGQCVAGRWTGSEVELVGASLILPLSTQGDDHPEGFAGPLDNWHIHYNLCTGPRVTGGTLARETCNEQGGTFTPTYGWMMHAWVDPDHDNQLGVFGMWNPTIWPVSDPEALLDSRVNEPENLPEGAAFASIDNLTFPDVQVAAGLPVVWANTDGVSHNITAGTPSDPDGSFGTADFGPAETAELTFDEPGEYSFYCSLHPSMRGTVTVE